ALEELEVSHDYLQEVVEIVRQRRLELLQFFLPEDDPTGSPAGPRVQNLQEGCDMSGPKIGITGSYGGLNLGDEAILQSILEQLRREVPDAEITVFSRDAEDTKRRHQIERAVPVRKLSRAEVVPEVERLDLLLFGGGGILYDADARTYLREVLVAKEHGVPVMLFAVGAGPLTDANVQAAVRDALDGV